VHSTARSALVRVAARRALGVATRRRLSLKLKKKDFGPLLLYIYQYNILNPRLMKFVMYSTLTRLDLVCFPIWKQDCHFPKKWQWRHETIVWFYDGFMSGSFSRIKTGFIYFSKMYDTPRHIKKMRVLKPLYSGVRYFHCSKKWY
jgi:hypothetical protein